MRGNDFFAELKKTLPGNKTKKLTTSKSCEFFQQTL
jgi:hypothetical protein